MKAQGRIADAVYVDEVGPANRLYSKGFTGEPQPGNGLKLSFIEAAFAQEEGRLETEKSLAELLMLAGSDAEVQYLVYRDLRERGLVTRHNGTGFDVWRRSETPRQKKWFSCFPHGERTCLGTESLQDGVYSVADNDGVVTHYWTTKIEPKGTVPTGEIPQLSGTTLADRVLVDGTVPEYMGTAAGEHTILSLTEAQSLVNRGVLSLDKILNAPRLNVYTDLRRRGVVTKSGFRFGTHFRGYADNPDKIHAQWLIECPESPMDWSHVSRGVRLAHGVKKQFVIAANGYWHMDWFKP